MSGSEGGGGPNPRVPLGLSLEQARELGRENAIHQLQQNYQVLSAEVRQLTSDLGEVLHHLREDLGRGGRRRTPLSPRAEPIKFNHLPPMRMSHLGGKGDHLDPR